MKKLLLPILCFLSVASWAQSSFFLQPFAGGGLTNMFYKTGGQKAANLENAGTFDGGILAGYGESKWVFQTGLQYLRTGYKVTITYTDAHGRPIGTKGFYTYLNQLTVPLGVGHTFRGDRQVAFTPSAGAVLSYNVSGTQSGPDTKLHPMPKDEFSNNYVPLSAFCFAKLDLDIYLSDRLSIIAGPAFYYMLSNVTRTYYPASYSYSDEQHTYALLLNAGLKWQPGKKDHNPEDDEAEPE